MIVAEVKVIVVEAAAAVLVVLVLVVLVVQVAQAVIVKRVALVHHHRDLRRVVQLIQQHLLLQVQKNLKKLDNFGFIYVLNFKKMNSLAFCYNLSEFNSEIVFNLK